MTIYTWLAIFVIALVIEGCTNALIAVWFAPSALVSLVLALLNVNFTVQMIVFILLSAVLLLVFYKKIKENIQKKGVKTNTDAIIGKNAVVEEQINPGTVGRVKVGGISWSAFCPGEKEPIQQGKIVTVKGIEGVKLICELENTQNVNNAVFESKS